MKLAFTSPMKPLDHPVPSGDRTLARLLVRAFQEAGHTVDVATRFQSWRKSGGQSMQEALKTEALREAEAVAASWRSTGYVPDAFVTYHLYHKAPDWIGPALAREFNCPYIVIEASRAPKQATGDWAFGFAEADKALEAADQVVALHRADATCLRDLVGERLSIIPPFIDTDPFDDAPALAVAPKRIKLLAVGMMRPGAKMRSYEVLAQALERVQATNWELTIVGDGPERTDIHDMFCELPAHFVGSVATDAMPAFYSTNDILVWPAVREAFGFVFLEAQAAGRPVVGGDTFGVPDIVAHGVSGLLSAEGDVDAFAANLQRLLEDPQLCNQMGQQARAHVLAHHSLEAGTQHLDTLLLRAKDHFAHKHQTGKIS